MAPTLTCLGTGCMAPGPKPVGGSGNGLTHPPGRVQGFSAMASTSMTGR